VGKITMAMDENVQVKIHTSSITVDNLKDFPTIVKISNKILVCSLMNGVCDIINSDTNGSISIQTPRVPIVLKKGKYRIVVQGKTTVLAVIDGLATIHNTIESKSPIQITSGNFAHVSTYYSLSTKGLDTLNNGKATVSIKPIQADDLKKIQTSCDQLDVLKNNIVFCVIDKKIVGVKLTD
jgi:hypothetical protein